MLYAICFQKLVWTNLRCGNVREVVSRCNTNIFAVSWPKNRRIFFENYAKQNGFDPLIPDNWYTQPRRTILSTMVRERLMFT